MNITYPFFLWTTTETIFFLTFIFVCAALIKSRFTIKITVGIILAGIVLSAALNAAVFLGSRDLAFTLGLLPLTVYIPAIILLHLMSERKFFETVPVWCIGLFGMYAVRFSVKMSIPALTAMDISIYACNTILLLIPLAVMSVICIVTVKYIRKPFNQYIRYSGANWILPLILVLLIVALFSYFSNSTYEPILSFLLFLIAIAAFLVIAKLFQAEYDRQQLKKEQDAYETRIRMSQNEYREIARKHELLREYRHDMRHHLLALSNILHDSDSTQAEEYINTLVERLENTENVVYCKNQIINAVLSSYITKAKKIGCVLDTHISIPEKLEIQDIDLCVILANALENAVNACEKEEENHRHIKIKIGFQNALHISIKNSCNETIVFDENGLPITASKQEHGIGMKSIANTVEKYNGILKCECSDGEFYLKSILFNISEEGHKPYVSGSKKTAAAKVLFILIGICVFLNLSPAVAEALAEIPVIGPVVQVITFRHHQSGWGQNKFDVLEPKVLLKLPMSEQKNPPESAEANAVIEDVQPSTAADMPSSLQPDDKDLFASSAGSVSDNAPLPSATPVGNAASAPETSIASATTEIPPTTPEQKPTAIIQEIAEENPSLAEGVEEINDKMSEYIEALRQKYNWYKDRKYMGYVTLESTYTILCNNDDMLTIRFDSTLNAGGSVNFSRCFTLDKRTGSVLELADLFQKDTDYITPISSYILEEMTRQVENGTADFFIPGGIWFDDECFKSIAKDQNFYINEQGKLVIVFDEYEVAPGSMGVVEFVIPTDTIHAILAEPSLIH